MCYGNPIKVQMSTRHSNGRQHHFCNGHFFNFILIFKPHVNDMPMRSTPAPKNGEATAEKKEGMDIILSASFDARPNLDWKNPLRIK
jgi:hypothetical protein